MPALSDAERRLINMLEHDLPAVVERQDAHREVDTHPLLRDLGAPADVLINENGYDRRGWRRSIRDHCPGFTGARPRCLFQFSTTRRSSL